jgi:hypothetical protein
MDGSINFSGTLAGSIADSGGGKIQDVQTNASGEYSSVVDEQGVAKIDLSNYATDEQLENAVDNINDVLLTKQNVINYSTNEQVVGTWFGQPRYSRSYRFTTSNLPADRVVFDTLTNVKEIIKIEGAYSWLNFQSETRLDVRGYALGEDSPQANNKAIWLLLEGNDNTGENFDLDFNFNGKDRSKVINICATVEYTKTTDTTQ